MHACVRRNNVTTAAQGLMACDILEVLGAVVKFVYHKQNDKNGMLICVYVHVQGNIFCVELSGKYKAITPDTFISLPTQHLIFMLTIEVQRTQTFSFLFPHRRTLKCNLRCTWRRWRGS